MNNNNLPPQSYINNFIDTRINNTDRGKFPSWGWLFPCIVCFTPTTNIVEFKSIRSRTINFNNQPLNNKDTYSTAICALCQRRIINGDIKTLKLK